MSALATDVEVVVGQETEPPLLILNHTGHIAGNAYLEDGAELEDNHLGILVYIAGTSLNAMTDRDGSYMIYNVPISDEEYELIASKPGYENAITTVNVPQQNRVFYAPDLTLRKIGMQPVYGSIEGEVCLQGTTDGIPGAIVYLSGTSYIAMTDHNGQFKIRNVSSGSYTLIATKDGYSGTTTDCDVTVGQIMDVGILELSELPTRTAPVAFDRSVTTPEDTARDIELLSYDYENDLLTYHIDVEPGHGALVQDPSDRAVWNYTPDPNYSGFDYFIFHVNDGLDDSNLAAVNIDVGPINDLPAAFDQEVVTDEEIPVDITLQAVDSDNDPLTFHIDVEPEHGILEQVNGPDWRYTPTENFFGSDSFVFHANDGLNGSNLATVSINIRSVNDQPVAYDQDVETDVDTPVDITFGASDPEGDPLEYLINISPRHGFLEQDLIDAALWTYTPNPGYLGSDSFTFHVNDGSEDSNIATIDIVISGNILYVDQDAIGTNDGSSWGNAFNDLQDAIAFSSEGKQIWVAQGIYKPTVGLDREVSFELKPGVAIYGGFAGDESALDQRNWILNVTTLSGDIGVYGDDVDNSYHVVVGADNAMLDGFIITDGNADGSDLNSAGGGMFNGHVSPTVTNCTFSNNDAVYGAGMWNFVSSPTVTNCNFTGNFASNGAGMFIYYESPIVTNCTFTSNFVWEYGGGMYNSLGSPNVTNSTFTGNEANLGGGLYTDGGLLTVTNCILWGNTGNQIHGNPDEMTVTYSDVQGWWGGEGNIDEDPLFVSSPDGDYYLSQIAAGQGSDSPCVNAGSDTAESLGLDDMTTRTDGKPDEGQVDMGFHYVISGEIPASSIVINEVDYDNSGTDEFEFVEIYNPSNSTVDLTNLDLLFINGADNSIYLAVSLASQGNLLSEEYLVIASPNVTVAAGAKIFYFSQNANSIQNGEPDGIVLINRNTNMIIDALSYEGSITSADLSSYGFSEPVSLIEGSIPTVQDSGDGCIIRYPNGQDTNNASLDWAHTSTTTPGSENAFHIPGDGLTLDFLHRLNDERISAGVGPVTFSDSLEQAALRHSTDMNDTGNLSHTGSDGSSFYERIFDAGYTGGPVAEVLSVGLTTADEIIDLWMLDPATRDHLLIDSATEVGAAIVGNFCTLVYGRAL
jgi:hypothetical protein